MAERAAADAERDIAPGGENDAGHDAGPDRDAPPADVLPFPSLGRRHRPSAAPATPRLRTVIGDVLREERHEQRRTLADVADAAAVSLPYLSEVERGTKEVSSDLLDAICAALDLELVDVLERSVRRLRPQARGGSGVLALAA